MSRSQRWCAATAGMVALVLVAGWMLLISPQRSHASDLRSQADAAQAQVASLQLQANRLKAKKTDVACQTALIEGISAQVPPTEDLANYLRSLTAAANDAGIDLQSIAPAAPAPLQVAAPPKPKASATPTADTATATVPPVGSGATGVSLISIQLGVAGSYFEIRQFLENLEGLTRATDVVSVSLVTGGSRSDQGARSVQAADIASSWQTLGGTITLDIFMTNAPLAVATTPPPPSASCKGSK